jgi:two-component system, chemotaxis family, protein-glutamate methylesterase/glutaminase
MFEAVVIGTSAGGVQALKAILPLLPATYPMPIAIVQHISPQSDAYLAELLNGLSAIAVKEAEDKEALSPGTAYFAPPGYHLLINPDRSMSLSVDEKVNFARPSIDLLFESASDTFANTLIGVVLTGANADGAKGLKAIKKRGGLAIVQSPQTAESPSMPRAALAATPVDYTEDLDHIAALLRRLGREEGDGTSSQH